MSHYAILPANSSTQVITSAGILVGLYSPGGSPPINIYDTSTGSTAGTKILEIPSSGENPFSLIFPDVQFEHGLYIVTNNIEPTVFYQ